MTSYDGSEVCACGDSLDEHDNQGNCLVEDCPCFYFDLEVAEPDE